MKSAEVFRYFEEICQVPRPSKKEGKIIAYLQDFGKQHNLETHTDEAGNILMKKPATPGMENRKTVALQAHMDMVCEKNNDVQHDFENDPIETYIDGEWVRARGTTLGADNGIGMAAALAVLVSDDLVHGPIEALFTVDEETGLTGANNLGEGMIEGDILLNLDSEEDGEICIGCAGGIDTTVTFRYKQSLAPERFLYFKINITGLQGGHSGTDINTGRACANKLLARFLWDLSQDYEVSLSSINGGNLRNAIAREAHAVVGIHCDHKEELSIRLNRYIADIENEYKHIEKDMVITIESTDVPEHCIDAETAQALIRSLYCAPHGVVSMSHDIPGLVETSTNLASVKMMPGNEILVTTSQRSSVESRKLDIAHQVEAVFQLAGATVTHGDGYPGWAPNMDSQILQVATSAYETLFNATPRATAIHAGLECGLFLTNYPHLDMISFGPTLRDVHSPKEAMHIPAVQKFWDYLAKILEMVARG